MCCGSKRSALSSASASRTSPRAVPAPPRTETAAAAPVTAEPINPAREVDVSDAAVFASSDSSRQSPQRQSVSPHLGRRWRLSS
jgi:hypothetical protein